MCNPCSSSLCSDHVQVPCHLQPTSVHKSERLVVARTSTETMVGKSRTKAHAMSQRPAQRTHANVHAPCTYRLLPTINSQMVRFLSLPRSLPDAHILSSTLRVLSLLVVLFSFWCGVRCVGLVVFECTHVLRNVISFFFVQQNGGKQREKTREIL